MERKESYNKRDSRIKSILFGCVLLCIGVACFFLRRVLDPYQDTISLIGSICSIIGLVWTFRQVVKLVDISNASKDAIDEYKKDVNRHTDEEYNSLRTLYEVARNSSAAAETLVQNLLAKLSSVVDPDFVPIGNPDIIDKRTNKPIGIEPPGGVLGEYVPFYFSGHPILLY